MQLFLLSLAALRCCGVCLFTTIAASKQPNMTRHILSSRLFLFPLLSVPTRTEETNQPPLFFALLLLA
jgi:hypothetical protein